MFGGEMREFTIEKDFDERYYKTESFGIFSFVNDNLPEAPHTHQFVEILYVLGGKAANFINGKLFEISHGDLVFVNYGSIHSFKPHGRFEYINIGIKPESLLKQISDKNAASFIMLTDFDEIKKNDERILSFYGEERIQIECLLKIMLYEARNTETRRKFILDSCLNIVIFLILDKVSRLMPKRGIDDFDELIKYVCENLREKLSLEEFAKMCYYNPSYFSRFFKKKYGMTFSEFIKTKRIEEAKILLEKNMTIEYIVSHLGFSSNHIFYSSFLEITGQTVSEYRKSLKYNIGEKVKS